ncbi:MAG: pyridoxal phosphate-dependent aminotransferase [Calditrichaeota bacterium]|nr:pyridoxal phosphate-dependent aminotransferase [Calditrichota bacterium]MCB9367746.1 pyridoxal phosphate-dependent aminotransferase [Calditrichota bacterium]
MLSSRVSRLSISQTLAIVEKVRELQKQGMTVYDMSVGEPDHPSPPDVKEAGRQAISNDFTRYTAAAGIMELREAIAAKLKRDNGLTYTPKQIVVGNGAKHILSGTLLALVEPGDEVIIPEPCWLSYPEMVWLAGGEVVYAPTRVEDGFHLRAEVLERLITPRTKAVMLNSPCNPTGAVMPKKDMDEIAEVLKKHRAYIISDEIYEYLRFDGREHVSLAQYPWLYDRTIVVNGVSKSYSMTGWRIGYGAGPDNVMNAILRIQSQMTSSACSVSQKAATAALNGGLDFPNRMRDDFTRRRDICFDGLKNIPGVNVPKPEGAFYAFPQIPAMMTGSVNGKPLKDSNGMTDYLLEKYHVAIVPGAAFRAPDCIRISFASSDDHVREAVNRIAAAVSDIK